MSGMLPVQDTKRTFPVIKVQGWRVLADFSH
jgi:hypothetical protein